jgi:hypothetical protein
MNKFTEYAKVYGITILYLLAGCFLIALFDSNKPEEPATVLSQILAFVWGFIVYIVFTIPAIQDIRSPLTEDAEEIKDDKEGI